MTKRFAALLLVSALLLAACGKGTAGGSAFEKEPVRENVEFAFEDIENPGYTMLYEPLPGSVTTVAYGLNMAQSTDSDGAPDGQYDSNYIIYDTETKTQRGTVAVRTAPPDPMTAFGVDTAEAVTDAMRPHFFPTMDVHESLRRSVVEDFGYKLTVDWSGTAYGWKASYIEFIDEETQNHGLRFYTSNDEMNEEFYAFDCKIDVPAGDAALLELYRSIIFSLHPMFGA